MLSRYALIGRSFYVWNVAKVHIGRLIEALGAIGVTLDGSLGVGDVAADTVAMNECNAVWLLYGAEVGVDALDKKAYCKRLA